MSNVLTDRQVRWLKEMRKVNVVFRIGRIVVLFIVLLSLCLPVTFPVFFGRPDLIWGSMEFCYSHPAHLKMLGMALIFIWFCKVNENYLKIINRITENS
ncbi:MAG: hypothetical protein KAR05_05800 [Candidatus Omnitrophica bacterium]|nr:hypothetical protein [Candidatus Omnitrophota bacterium]